MTSLSFVSIGFLAIIIVSTIIAATTRFLTQKRAGQSVTYKQFEQMDQTDTITFLQAVRLKRRHM